MKKLFLSIFAASAVLMPGVSKAGNLHDDHAELWKTLQDIGIVTLINHTNHCNDRIGLDGIYYTHAGMLVICQEKMIPGSDKQFNWTVSDYNTLRHEAHHVVQDCAAGGYSGDGKTTTLFNEDEFEEFVGMSSYSIEDLKELYSRLYNKGLSKKVIREEIEAYVVAQDIDAESIKTKLIEFCSR